MSDEKVAYDTANPFNKKHYDIQRMIWSLELKNPLGVFYESPLTHAIYVNLISDVPLFAGEKVAFDRGADQCNIVTTADYGRLCGVVLVAANIGYPALVSPRGMLDFTRPVTLQSIW